MTHGLRLSRPSLPSLNAYTELLETTWDDGWLSNFGPPGGLSIATVE